MGLKRKYYLFMLLGVSVIPIIFLLANYIVWWIILLFQNQLNIKTTFYGAGPTLFVYFIFFSVLISIIVIGSTYIQNIIKRMKIIKNVIRDIAYDESLPSKIVIENSKNDELDSIVLSTNILIDRLKYKELKLQQSIEEEKISINQLIHDINTPLTSLKLELYILSEQYNIPNSEMKNIYDRIDYTAELSKNLKLHNNEIDNFYTFSYEVNINEIIKIVLEKWAFLLSKKNIVIRYNIQETMILYGEEIWFKRLFENIISNIYRHSEANLVILTVNAQYISVYDNGHGFNIEKVNHKNGLDIIESISNRFNLTMAIDSDMNGTTIFLRK